MIQIRFHSHVNNGFLTEHYVDSKGMRGLFNKIYRREHSRIGVEVIQKILDIMNNKKANEYVNDYLDRKIHNEIH